jgi:hypothetical protein
MKHHNSTAGYDVYNHGKILKLILNLSFYFVEYKNSDLYNSLVPVNQPSCFIQFFIPEDGPRGPKHVVNEHRLSCVDLFVIRFTVT